MKTSNRYLLVAAVATVLSSGFAPDAWGSFADDSSAKPSAESSVAEVVDLTDSLASVTKYMSWPAEMKIQATGGIELRYGSPDELRKQNEEVKLNIEITCTKDKSVKKFIMREIPLGSMELLRMPSVLFPNIQSVDIKGDGIILGDAILQILMFCKNTHKLCIDNLKMQEKSFAKTFDTFKDLLRCNQIRDLVFRNTDLNDYTMRKLSTVYGDSLEYENRCTFPLNVTFDTNLNVTGSSALAFVKAVEQHYKTMRGGRRYIQITFKGNSPEAKQTLEQYKQEAGEKLRSSRFIIINVEE